MAAKIALHSAGAKGGRPGSPTPLDGTSIPAETMCASVTGGDSSMRSTPIAVVVARFDAAFLEADLAIERETHSHHGSAFDLRANTLGVGGEAAIDRRVDARHGQMSLLVHSRLDDGSDIGEEAAMDGNAESMPRRQLATPIRLLRYELRTAILECLSAVKRSSRPAWG